VIFAFAVAIVVHVEPSSEAEADIEREGADERTCPIAARLEHRRQRFGVCRKSESCVLTDAVMKRVAAGENVGVRRQCDDRRGMRVREADAVRREPVDPRRRDGLVPVRADGVGAQRVDRNQENVPQWFVPGRGPTARQCSGDRCHRDRNVQFFEKGCQGINSAAPRTLSDPSGQLIGIEARREHITNVT
jgi:hypothetical protein